MDIPRYELDKDLSGPVTFPAEVEAILNLALNIIGRHQTEGVNSPLRNQLVADLHYKTTLAKSRHDEGMKYLKLMEEAFAERDSIVASTNGNLSKGGTITDILSSLAQSLVEADSRLLVKWGFTLK